MEHDFFGPRAAKRRQRRRSPQKMKSAGTRWGRIQEGEQGPLRRRIRKEIEGRTRRARAATSNTPSQDGRRIEAPLGGVPPPNVFGVRRFAIRKGVEKNKALRFEFSWRRLYGFCFRFCAPPARAAENMPKVSKEPLKIIQQSPKIEP